MNSKKLYTIVGVVIILIILGLLSSFYIRNKEHRQGVLKKCPELSKYSVVFYECFGIIAIEGQPDDNYSNYLVVDYKHNFYVIAGIENLNGFKVMEDNLYTIDMSRHSSTTTLPDGTVKYIVSVFQDGRPTELQFNKPEDIPNYVVVDTKSGEVRRYRTTDEIPENSRAIFRELEKH